MLISVDEALALLLRHRTAPRAETLPLERAAGRVLAEPIIAQLDRPSEDISAMDGYACRLLDVAEPGARLRVIGEAPAGSLFSGHVRSGTAVRIFTGAVLPEGADHIVIQEHVEREGDHIVCRDAEHTARHIRKAGLDFNKGDELASKGRRLDPTLIGVAAAANLDVVSVAKKLRVGILANGNELKPPGQVLGPGETVNSNPFALASLIEAWGGEPVDLGVARDELGSIEACVEAAPDLDLYLPVGGASVGDHDLMRPAFEGLGFEPIFSRIAVRPGKPTWFSVKGHQAVLGLPGNPASAIVCAHLFLYPLLVGASLTPIHARLAAGLAGEKDRESYLRGTLRQGDDGQLWVKPAPNQDSSLMKPFADGQVLVHRAPRAAALAAGDVVSCLMMAGASL